MSDSDNTDPPEKGTWFMQMNGDLDYPTGRLSAAVNPGWGGDISVGYHLPKDFEVGIELGYDTYSQRTEGFTGSWNMAPLVMKITYFITKETFQPYLFLAGGFAFNTRYTQTGSFSGPSFETDFLGEMGLGLSILIEGYSSVFVQTKMELDNTSASYAADQPTILIPINVGIKFPLN